jgi:CRP/FNR family transcriptional regulator
MSSPLRTLAQVPFFNGLSDAELSQIHAIAQPRDCSRQELIFGDGDEGSGFYLVVSGRVKVYKLSPEGKEQILHILGPGEPLGQVAVFENRAFPANAEALVDSRLLFFPRPAFRRLLSDNPSLALNMLGVMSRRLREFTQQVESLSLKEVPSRLAAYLLARSREQGLSPMVHLAISKSQLANLLGTIPETLSRILARLSARGLIRVQGRQIELRDRQGLEELAAHGKLTDACSRG